MLTVILNDSKDGIKFLFRDIDTKEKKYEESFDLTESKRLCQDLSELIKNAKGCHGSH